MSLVRGAATRALACEVAKACVVVPSEVAAQGGGCAGGVRLAGRACRTIGSRDEDGFRSLPAPGTAARIWTAPSPVTNSSTADSNRRKSRLAANRSSRRIGGRRARRAALDQKLLSEHRCPANEACAICVKLVSADYAAFSSPLSSSRVPAPWPALLPSLPRHRRLRICCPASPQVRDSAFVLPCSILRRSFACCGG